MTKIEPSLLAPGPALAVTLILLASAGGAAHADEEPPQLRLARKPETRLDGLQPVGGAVLMGLTARGEDRVAELRHLRVLLAPAGGARFLCVTLRTDDGRYRGAFLYDAQGRPAGPYRLETTGAPELKDYSSDRVAVLAVLKGDQRCSVEPDAGALGTVLVAGWRNVNAGSGLRAFLNAERARSWMQRGDARISERCDVTAPERPKTTFDTLCVLRPLPAGTSRVDVVSRALGNVAETLSFDLALP